MACISLINNFYSYYTKNFHFELIIADSKENIKKTSKISFYYKVKFIYYIIVTIITLTFIMTKILKIIDKNTLKKIKIYKIKY